MSHTRNTDLRKAAEVNPVMSEIVIYICSIEDVSPDITMTVVII